MKRVIPAALVAALLAHGGILLFGGLLIFHAPKKAEVREEVDLVDGAEDPEAKEKEKQKETEAREASKEDAPVEAQAEEMPDLHQLSQLEGPAAAPALAALSLSDLEGALGAGTGGGAFADGFSLASGGRIGGTGAAGGGEGLDDMISVADLDQRPRPIFQAAPSYPVDLRKRGVAGTVEVVFYVDRDGHVQSPKVEKSSHQGFERPALEAVRQWRFEAGTRNGQKVAFKMRVPITFHAG